MYSCPRDIHSSPREFHSCPRDFQENNHSRGGVGQKVTFLYGKS